MAVFTTLLVVVNHDTAAAIQRQMPPEIMVIGAGAALVGRSFTTIIVTREAWESNQDWVDTLLPLKVKPGGSMFRV